MTEYNFTFADILHPVTPEEFFAEYHDKKPLHTEVILSISLSVRHDRTEANLSGVPRMWSGFLS